VESFDKNTVISLRLDGVQPMSTNHMYYTFRRKGAHGTFKTKSQDYLKFIEKVHETLQLTFQKYPELTEKVRAISTENCPMLEIIAEIPKKSYITQAGKLKPNDCSNFIKSTEDALFSYFADQISPDLKDQQVMRITSAKQLAEGGSWILTINIYLPEILDTQKVYQFSHYFAT
jgi:hypothetical protein